MADEKPQTVERHSWDRRHDESKRAWTAFQLYRDSPDRRLATVAKALTPPCSTANIGRWVSRHNWQQRARDFDCWVDEQNIAEMARGRVSSRKRRLAVAHALEGLSAHAIKEWQTRLAAGLPLGLSLADAALLSKTAAQLAEQALGPEHENRFAQIVVNLGEFEYEDERVNRDAAEPTTIDGEKKKLLN